jgi:twitching motility two-component system response regulator PilG
MTSYRYRSPQELHVLSILAQSVSRQVSGCLRIADATQTWLLYLEQGKLLYASDSVDPLGRLDRHLRRLSSSIPTLVSPVRVQVRLLFETSMSDDMQSLKDYEALCWLVEQQYLTVEQAGKLIEVLAKEVLESLLPLQVGTHDFIEQAPLVERPHFCALDVRSLVESCQIKQTRRTTSTAYPTTHAPIQPLRVPQNTDQRNSSQALPMRAAVTNPPPSASTLAGQAVPPRLSQPLAKTSYTIACIDDSPTVLSAIETFLDDQAFKVIQIQNPVSALMKIIRTKPDLILLDVTMPSLDGYELCSLLRRHPAFKHIPIIMVTGNRGFIDRAKAKLVGASGYLTKPFTQPDLLKIVFKHLS